MMLLNVYQLNNLITDELKDPQLRSNIHDYDGHWRKSMQVMFEFVIVPGVWEEIGLTLVYYANFAYMAYLSHYARRMIFALGLIVMAMLHEETSVAVISDQELMTEDGDYVFVTSGARYVRMHRLTGAS